MPSGIELLSTIQLLDIADGNSEQPFTVLEAVNEMKARVVPNDYPDVAMRGGIRPTNPNL